MHGPMNIKKGTTKIMTITLISSNFLICVEAAKKYDAAIGVNVINSANHKTSTYTFYPANCSLTFVKHNSVAALKNRKVKVSTFTTNNGNEGSWRLLQTLRRYQDITTL
jgi:hypothetical protein